MRRHPIVGGGTGNGKIESGDLIISPDRAIKTFGGQRKGQYYL